MLRRKKTKKFPVQARIPYPLYEVANIKLKNEAVSWTGFLEACIRHYCSGELIIGKDRLLWTEKKER